jgi:signal transduction histidine kinase
MTAALPPSRTAATLGVGPKPAADVRLTSDLIAEAQRHADVSRNGHTLRLDLEVVERAFGRVILDERVRSGVIAARERALRLSEASGRSSETLSLTFAADLFVAIAVDRGWPRRSAGELVAALAGVIGMAPQEVSVQLLTAALRTPQLLELPPLVGLDVQLSMLLALSPAVEGSLWVRDESGRIECVLSAGETATTRRFRAVALRTIEGREAEGESGLIVGVPVRRWHSPWAALVVRVRSRELVEALLDEAAAAISPIVEREFLLQRNAAHERTLVKASERRLSRLGFDLHDGALQHIAALAADIRHLRPQLASTFVTQLDGVEKRVSELDRVLRELAHSLEPASLLRRPLERVIEAEIKGLTERSGIDVRSRVVGDFGAMTQSQKIALIRIVQEAFTNIREHSNATCVAVVITGGRSCVEVQIEDDGDGFEVTRTLQDAAQRGRLGLVGSSERVRLLGGTFDIRSRPGGPTTVAMTLPRWQPLVAKQDATLQLAY